MHYERHIYTLHCPKFAVITYEFPIHSFRYFSSVYDEQALKISKGIERNAMMTQKNKTKTSLTEDTESTKTRY